MTWLACQSWQDAGQHSVPAMFTTVLLLLLLTGAASSAVGALLLAHRDGYRQAPAILESARRAP